MLLILSGVGYYFLTNSQNQAVNSVRVFENTKNFFPFGKETPPAIQTQTATTSNIQKASVQPQKSPQSGIRIVTNGTTNPNIDLYYKNQTTYKQDGKSLDSTTDNYVTVPENTIPIGSRVYVIDKDTGRDIWGVVGDYGPYGGISLYSAEQLGIWQAGMGMKLLPHILEFKYYER